MHRPDPFGPARVHLYPRLALLGDTRARLAKILSVAIMTRRLFSAETTHEGKTGDATTYRHRLDIVE
ncbi:MAG: hypothetical protein QNK37_37960 [Acidobacteriota bacterium]|nr:hypothetical protein [Acidobacteriota bacterium]